MQIKDPKGSNREQKTYLLVEVLKPYGKEHPAYKLATIIVMTVAAPSWLLGSAYGPGLVRGLMKVAKG